MEIQGTLIKILPIESGQKNGRRGMEQPNDNS